MTPADIVTYSQRREAQHVANLKAPDDTARAYALGYSNAMIELRRWVEGLDTMPPTTEKR